MKLRLPFVFNPVSRPADNDYACGMNLLKANERRRAFHHFRRAVRQRPSLAADIAQHCVSKQHPKLALQVLDEYKRVPERVLNLDHSIHVSSVYAAAHHALSHSHSGHFQSKHNTAEISYLENVTDSSTWTHLDGFSRFSLALAEGYSHVKFGLCLAALRSDKEKRSTRGEDANLFVRMMDIALFRLDHGDEESLDIIETFSNWGPPPEKHAIVIPLRRRLRESMQAFVEYADGANKDRAIRLVELLSE